MTQIARRSLLMLATLVGVLTACSSPTAPVAAAPASARSTSVAPNAGAMCGVIVGSDSHC
jgi:hypothetical protein